MKRLLFCSLLFFSCQSSYKAKVIRVVDGDTYLVLHKGYTTKIRLSDVDAPELSQTFGIESKNFAAKYLLSKEVTVTEKESDKYGRKVAAIEIGNAIFSDILLSNGMCHATKFSSQRAKNEYSQAKRNKVGLFQYPYELPFIYRELLHRSFRGQHSN